VVAVEGKLCNHENESKLVKLQGEGKPSN